MTELHLNQHLSQELRLSQETIQSLKMLTLNQWALMDYLEGVSLENPLVEVDFEGIRQESTAVKEGDEFGKRLRGLHSPVAIRAGTMKDTILSPGRRINQHSTIIFTTNWGGDPFI